MHIFISFLSAFLCASAHFRHFSCHQNHWSDAFVRLNYGARKPKSKSKNMAKQYRLMKNSGITSFSRCFVYIYAAWFVSCLNPVNICCLLAICQHDFHTLSNRNRFTQVIVHFRWRGCRSLHYGKHSSTVIAICVMESIHVNSIRLVKWPIT